MCPSATFRPFPRMFCGKEIRAIYPTNDCELDFAYMCKNPSKLAQIRHNCSEVPYSDDSITKLYRVCDFNKMHLDCNNSTCCDFHGKARGRGQPYPAKGIDRYRLTLTANYDVERKAWYSDCFSHLKTLSKN
jgi:hypothetical protein